MDTVTPTLTHEQCATIVTALWAMADATMSNRTQQRHEACLDALRAIHETWDKGPPPI